MSLWTALRDLTTTLGQATGSLVDRLVAAVSRLGSDRRQVAFTVAVIALSAKMARADGIVTADEVQAFRRVVEIPPGEEANVQRLFDLAHRDVAGFDVYATRMAELAEGDRVLLADVLDGLFHIATADAFVHQLELDYLRRVARLFGFDDAAFRRTAARHMRFGRSDPYEILGVAHDAGDDAVRAAWLRLVQENHPDRHVSKGLPTEALRLLTDRLAQVNGAYEAIRRERGA
jgi:DnaJ like chaperone protein